MTTPGYKTVSILKEHKIRKRYLYNNDLVSQSEFYIQLSFHFLNSK